MKEITQKFRVYKKKLPNGLTILARPTHTIPEVVTQLWYNVGSKDEEEGERGMAHLIEHMIFKGTKKLSEIDINLITFKLSGYANAFTSNDYTGYIFKFPSNVWHEGLAIMADCMKNARFDEQMLNSELHAVIQELKLYKDDYQSTLIERMMAGIFPQHPYHHPIIGYKHDLWDLKRDDLYAFYKKHYHPANATLVVVGDVARDDVFAKAEKYFGKIKSPKNYEKKKQFFLNDICNVSVKIAREIDNPWAFYAYQVPGVTSNQGYLFTTLEFLIGRGRSSRLYEKLVNETKLATAVGSFTYDLFDKSLLYIYVQPLTVDLLPRIEKIIEEELKRLADSPIEEWEFLGVKKKVEISYCSLLESINQQAELIGSSFLATGDLQYLDNYMKKIQKIKRADIQEAAKKYLQPAYQHKGYLFQADEQEKVLWAELQKDSDELDRKILKNRTRKTPVEPGKHFIKIKEKPLPKFTYAVPKTFELDNGLEVIYHDNPVVPKVTVLLGFKGNYLYEPAELGGMSRFVSKLLLEGTKKYSAQELNRYLESNGITLSTDSGIIYLECLSKDLDKSLDILNQIVTEPAFYEARPRGAELNRINESIEKVRQYSLMELKEFWDSPYSFVNALAREVVYKDHPYAKNRLGYKECVERFSRDNIVDFYKQHITPQEATLVIVGDLSSYKKCEFSSLKKLVGKTLGDWIGDRLEDLVLPEITYKKPEIIHHSINRDQVVLAFAAPSISRLDKDYDSLAILDFILTGGGISANSRLFQLREQTGMFYTIGGSLVHGAEKAPGMMFIKTMVSLENVENAQKMIKKTVKNLRENGISQVELEIATKALITASTRVFESNDKIAQMFLFYKKCGINLDLFDKRGAILSILRIGAINRIAQLYCREKSLSTIKVGRAV